MSRILNSSEHAKPKILVVDDESSIRRILTTRLSLLGYAVVTAANGEEALVSVRQQVPDLIVLDVMMPKLDGYGVCQALRKESSVPIIMLTALADVADRIIGLEAGADDYMVKPFSPKELESRIRCILRRVDKPSPIMATCGVIQVNSLRIDTNKLQVYKDDELIGLTYIEFKMLEMLISRAGESITRHEILEHVWGYTPEDCGDTRVVDVHMSHLRQKLRESPSQPEFIFTIRGQGYAFQCIEY